MVCHPPTVCKAHSRRVGFPGDRPRQRRQRHADCRQADQRRQDDAASQHPAAGDSAAGRFCLCAPRLRCSRHRVQREDLAPAAGLWRCNGRRHWACAHEDRRGLRRGGTAAGGWGGVQRSDVECSCKLATSHTWRPCIFHPYGAARCSTSVTTMSVSHSSRLRPLTRGLTGGRVSTAFE